MPASTRVITLLTDFGLKDHFVSAMKGVMLGVNPDLNFVDITHSIPPQDIRSAAFTLSQTYPYFPPNTVHLAVVDPGVGSARKAIAVSAGNQFFVGPDNGILTYVLEGEADAVVYEITADHYFRKPVSSTFHGRDIFAPAAAWITRNISLFQIGPPLKNPVRLALPQVKRLNEKLLQAAILAVDHFGNLITNLKPEDLPAYGKPSSGACKIVTPQKKEITSFRSTYAEGNEGELFVLPGSTGYLEIVMRNGSAASSLGLSSGSIIGVVLSS